MHTVRDLCALARARTLHGQLAERGDEEEDLARGELALEVDGERAVVRAEDCWSGRGRAVAARHPWRSVAVGSRATAWAGCPCGIP